MKKEKSSGLHKVLNILGIIFCVILVPILIINCTLLIKGLGKDKSVPNVGGIFPLIVLTDSMVPVIDGGDMIICRTAEPEAVQVGDVIAFFDPAGNGTTIVTHRVTGITEENGSPAWRTRGDNNNTEDKMPVPFENLVGKWSDIRIPRLGNVAMFMQTTAGLIVCVVLPLALLVGYDLIRRRAYEKKTSQEAEQLMQELEELRRLKAEKEASQK